MHSLYISWHKRHREKQVRKLERLRHEVHRLRQLVEDPIAPSTMQVFEEIVEKNAPNCAFTNGLNSTKPK